MRGGKSFLVLLLVAGAIAAYVYFVESKRDLSESADTTKREKVWTLDSAKIEELEVKSAGGDVTRLKKNGQTWQIVSPEPMDADQDAVSTVLSAISSLESTKVVDENAASLAGFELEPARIHVSAKVTGEAAPKQLDLGTKTPTGADLYARVDGQKKVLLVGGSLEDQVNRSTFDLRDKTVLKFDRDKADSLKLEPASGGALSLVRKSTEEWRLAAPDAQADFSVIDGIVSKLSQARMKAVTAADGTKELKKYGLDKPQTVVTVGAGSSRASLAIGAKTPDGALYARDVTRPMVFTVEASLFDDVNKKAADLRQKMLFEFRSFTAISADITHGTETFAFVKQPAPAAASPNPANAPPPQETWKQTKPAARDVDLTKITDFLVNVANLKADTFVDRAAASGDDYVVTVKFGEPKAPKEERVTFRKSGTTVQALRAGEPGAAVVPTADFDKVVSGLKDLTGGK